MSDYLNKVEEYRIAAVSLAEAEFRDDDHYPTNSTIISLMHIMALADANTKVPFTGGKIKPS